MKERISQGVEIAREIFLDNLHYFYHEVMRQKRRNGIHQARRQLVEFFLDNPVNGRDVLEARPDYKPLFDSMRSAGIRFRDYGNQLKDASLTAYRMLRDPQPEEPSAFY